MLSNKRSHFNEKLMQTNKELTRALLVQGFPDGAVGKESTCNVGDHGLIPGLGRSSEEGIVYALQYSGLKNSMDKESDTTEQLSLSPFHFPTHTQLGKSAQQGRSSTPQK